MLYGNGPSHHKAVKLLFTVWKYAEVERVVEALIVEALDCQIIFCGNILSVELIQ